MFPPQLLGEPVPDNGRMKVSALDKPGFGVGHITNAYHDDALPRNAMEKRERMHQPSQSGTRSASIMAAAAMRSATTAKRSPSTSTSATKPRELYEDAMVAP